MKLNANDQLQIEDVTADDLTNYVLNLGSEEFCVLARDEETFIQVYRYDGGSLRIEYRAGSHDAHFAATSHELGLHDVLAMFIAYLVDDDATWRALHEWEAVAFDEDFDGDDVITHYELNGETLPRVRVGREQTIELNENRCVSCGAEVASWHEEGCEREECPRCHDAIHACACE